LESESLLEIVNVPREERQPCRRVTDDEVLRKYPALEAEDLDAVREYAVHIIKSRAHDEFTGRAILPRDQLRHGALYKGRCRNAKIGRWNAKKRNGFSFGGTKLSVCTPKPPDHSESK
jgi:hypothetical protein